MSAVAVVDCLEFARAEQQLRGRLPVVSLRRLDDMLFDSEGHLDYEVHGIRDERNRPQLALKIVGTLHLQCQRCLQLLDYRVDVANTLLLVPRGAPPVADDMDDPEGPDVIEALPDLDVAGLVEDEVLLSLPLAPRHPDGVCASKLGTGEGNAKPSAFARLAELKSPLTKN